MQELAPSPRRLAGWTLTDTHPAHGRAFRRPLGALETIFFWDGHFNGTADGVHAVSLRLLNHPRNQHLLGETNIVKAWLSTKRRYPLVAATVQLLPVTGEGDDTPASNPHFVVREHDLLVLRPNEIVFGQVACAEEVQQRISQILDGPRPLSNELLAQLYVLRETSSERTDTLHLITLIAHCVTDETANRTLMRCFLDTLARGGDPDSEPAQIPLEDRLAMVVSVEDLVPMHLRLLSPARRRWRMAIATIISRLRMAKIQGGHTLPCRRTRSTPYTPARSGYMSTMLTEAHTSTVTANCRLHGITFGNAYLVLAQVAMTRVLYRRYLRGEISEEEWEYRKRQPHHTISPMNLRPYSGKEWLENGGGGEFMVAINVYFLQHPFMTLDQGKRRQWHSRDLVDGAPQFSELLTFNRFLHRAGLARKRTRALSNHPLFLELFQAGCLDYSSQSRLLALHWTKHIENVNNAGMRGNSEDSDAIPVIDDGTPMTFGHSSSTLGDVDLVSPTEYPLPPSHPLSPFSPAPRSTRAGYVTPPPAMQVDTTPRIVVENCITGLHTRPGELYISALTSRRRMTMYVFYDRNVYEDGVVAEWLDEVKAAVLCYLGQTHAHARARL